MSLMHYAYKLIQRDKIDAQKETEREREQNRFCTKKPKLTLFIFLGHSFQKLIVTLLFCYYIRRTFTLKRKKVTVYTSQEQIMTFSSKFELALLLISMHDLFYLPLFLKRIKSKQTYTQFILPIHRL